MSSSIYLVGVPIGNYGDISRNSVEILSSADTIIGEENKETSTLLRKLGIKKNFFLLNEHSTPGDINEIISNIQRSSVSCLFSDAGMPLLSDPGLDLVRECIRLGINIRVCSGPSAFLVALLLSGFSTSPFTFCGFLPREPGERRKSFLKFFNLKHTILFYETPYRYKKAFREILEMVPPDTSVFLGLDLTGENEWQVRGRARDVLQRLDTLPKANPVLVIGSADLGVT